MLLKHVTASLKSSGESSSVSAMWIGFVAWTIICAARLSIVARPVVSFAKTLPSRIASAHSYGERSRGYALGSKSRQYFWT